MSGSREEPEENLVYVVPKDQRYWVVRADGGKYVDHFRTAGLIAVGHLDKLGLIPDKEKPLEFTQEKFADALWKNSQIRKETRRRYISEINQVISFVNTMKVGDLVIVPSYNSISFGMIISDAIFDNSAITLKSKEHPDGLEMTLGLRRSVSWGPRVVRDDFPIAIARSLRANQAVFNIDKHWEAMHHILYPIFTRDNQLYLSFRVEQSSSVSNFSISLFLAFLSKIEAFCHYEAEKWNTAEFENLIIDLYENNKLKLTTQAQIMSPGDIWAALPVLQQISSGSSTITVVFIIYSMLFGNSKLGIDGLIDLKTKHMIIEFFLSEWKKKGGEQVRSDLHLDRPSFETENLKLDRKTAIKKDD